MLLVCAASVAGAIFLVVEMDGAFNGFIAVPSDSMRRALAHMRQ